MVSDYPDEHLFKKHTDLCNKLNLDMKSLTDSWNSFQALSKNFVLEGDPLHWLACAVFVSCQKSITPTVVGQSIEGNCLNLTSLLRCCNLNLKQFYCNIRNWCDMANLPDDFRRKIDHSEQTFSVSWIIFKHYCTIYQKIFKLPEPSELENVTQHRNRKQKSVPCTTWRLFEFIWNLFITIRGEDSTYSKESVQSFHLLVTICDLAFSNAYLAERRDLFNPQFDGLPSGWLSSNTPTSTETPCIVDKISTLNKNETVAANHVKQYFLKDILSNYFEEGILLGDEKNFSGILDPAVFETNVTKITKVYETQLLNKGGFDDRIFLAECRRRLLEREHNLLNWNNLESGDDHYGYDSPIKGLNTSKGCETPLTGRRFLPKDPINITNSAIISQNITRLNALLSGCRACPSENLQKVFSSSPVNPTEKIMSIVSELGQRFLAGFVKISNREQTDPRLNEHAENRLQIGTTLFYKLIDSIIEHERIINKDISALLDKDVFYECIFAVALEIVIHSYNDHKKFPWILETLKIEPCHFVKVIELTVRSKDPFYRDTVKHLNRIEEKILEYLVWKSDSQLWETIRNSDQGIPKLSDIALPGHVLYTEDNNNEDSSQGKLLPSSPGPSATITFQSPISNSNSVNRQLFPINGDTSINRNALLLTDKDGNKRYIPIVETENRPKPQVDTQVVNNIPTKPRRTGSLAIFFRKFYNLAGVRLDHLCNKLEINDFELKRKIWTVFEDSIQNHSDELLKNRHLDQLLMCAVYVICKVSEKSKNFGDIMRCYRLQPQAGSHIYRNVLLTGKGTEVIDNEEREVPEQRGDLIRFYNQIYISVMTSFAMRFATTAPATSTSDILLSPLPSPCPKKNLISPSVKIASNVFVKPLDSSTSYMAGKSYNYFFSRSPSKDLKDINRAIGSNGIRGKRLLSDDDTDFSNKRIANRKTLALLEERKNQSME